MYKVFVGTLFNGENDFEKCCEIVNNQKNVIITHNIIKNQLEVPAHIQLTKDWLSVKNQHDFYIKIDADLVLKDENIIFDICNRMFENKIDYYQCCMHDYLSNLNLLSVNTWNTSIDFFLSNDKLYCDRNFKKEQKTCVFDKNFLIGNHMLYCSNIAAFRYGLHRGLKEQYNLRDKIRSAPYSLKRAYALEGFEQVTKFNNTTKVVDYHLDEFQKLFEKVHLKLGD